MKNPTDFLGQEIKVGDILVYPVRRGSSMWLKKITVTCFVKHAKATHIVGTNDSGRCITLMKSERSVVGRT